MQMLPAGNLTGIPGLTFMTMEALIHTHTVTHSTHTHVCADGKGFPSTNIGALMVKYHMCFSVVSPKAVSTKQKSMKTHL